MSNSSFPYYYGQKILCSVQRGDAKEIIMQK